MTNPNLTQDQQYLVQLFDKVRGRPMAEPEPSHFMTNEAATIILPKKLSDEQRLAEQQRVWPPTNPQEIAV